MVNRYVYMYMYLSSGKGYVQYNVDVTHILHILYTYCSLVILPQVSPEDVWQEFVFWNS